MGEGLISLIYTYSHTDYDNSAKKCCYTMNKWHFFYVPDSWFSCPKNYVPKYDKKTVFLFSYWVNKKFKSKRRNVMEYPPNNKIVIYSFVLECRKLGFT